MLLMHYGQWQLYFLDLSSVFHCVTSNWDKSSFMSDGFSLDVRKCLSYYSDIWAGWAGVGVNLKATCQKAARQPC